MVPVCLPRVPFGPSQFLSGKKRAPAKRPPMRARLEETSVTAGRSFCGFTRAMDCVEVEREAHLVADRIADETVHAEIGALDLALSLEADGTDSEIGRIWERRVPG